MTARAPAIGATLVGAMAPSPEDDDVGERQRRSGSPSSRAADAPSSGPRFDDVFVGREADLEALSNLVAGGERLITIVGPPGIGKTRLGAVAAPRLAGLIGADPGSVWQCDLTSARGSDGFCQAISAALRIPLGPGAVGQIGRALAGRGPSLFVLDNFEHLVAWGPTTVNEWLSAAPRLTFLVTAREVLRLRGERVHELGPLSIPSVDDEVWGSESGRLFLGRARAARAGYEPRATDAGVVAEIVRRLEGIPLAIELAAGQMAHVGASRILARAQSSLTTLASDRRDALPRHATLRAAIDASWQTLTPNERRVLAQVVVFRGGFDLDAAEAILEVDEEPNAAPVASVVGALREKSLLKIDFPDRLPDEGRISIYETIREFAGEHLEPAQRKRIVARHAAHYLARCEALVASVHGARGAEALGQLRVEVDNLIAAHEHALASSPVEAEPALRAALAVATALAFRGAVSLPLGLLDQALAAPVASTPPILRARALEARARALRLCGPAAGARSDYLAALDLIRGRDHPDLEAWIAWGLGLLAGDSGLRDEARRDLDRALTLARNVGERRVEGLILGSLGAMALLDGHPLEAEDHYQHACSVFRAAKDRRSEGFALSNLANLHADLDRDDVGALHDQVMIIAQEFECDEMAASVQATLGCWLHRRGRLDDARRSHEGSLAILRKLGDRRIEGIELGNLATVLHEQGDLEGACRCYQEAIATSRAAGMHHAELMFLAMLGGVLGARDLVERAEAVLQEAERHPSAQGDAVAREFVSLQRAHLDLALGDRALAEGDVDRAVRHRASAVRRVDLAEGHVGGAEVRPALVDRWSDARLTARILRRRLAHEPPVETSRHRVVLDARTHELRHDGQIVSFKRRPVLHQLLYTLVAAAGEAVSKATLAELAFGHPYASHRDDNPLRVNLNRLRTLVEPSGLRVEFEGGYRLVAPDGFLYIRAQLHGGASG
jgi:predicted ATPase